MSVKSVPAATTKFIWKRKNRRTLFWGIAGSSSPNALAAYYAADCVELTIAFKSKDTVTRTFCRA